MSNKKQQPTRRPPSRKAKQQSDLVSLLIPILVGIVVVVLIVAAIMTIEARQAQAAKPTSTFSVPVVTTEPQATTEIPYPDVPRISLKDTQSLLKKGQAVLIDVRGKAYYDQLHATGAISLPSDEVDARLSELPKDKLLILYCAWSQEATSASVAQTLIKDKGFTNVKVLLGGFGAWEQASLPTESSTP